LEAEEAERQKKLDEQRRKEESRGFFEKRFDYIMHVTNLGQEVREEKTNEGKSNEA
jgi:hypothetical protein